MRSPFEETVRGTIIGEITWPYEFWTVDGQHLIAKRGFENDREAIAWFKTNHPKEFAQGADMRCFDQD